MPVRPATPLAVLLAVAFALQLLAVLSTPVIQAIPLASNAGVTYGVFGFCNGDNCSPIGIGYKNPPNSNGFTFSSPSMRSTLASILIIHPVAALFTLVAVILSIIAHFGGPGKDPRFLLGSILFLFPTLLLSLVAFLADILLFIPHLGWAGWMVLAATIIIAVSSVLACAMRRTVVSREERKRQIAQNAEMNGENFYNRQNSSAAATSVPPLSQQPTNPLVNGAPGSDKLPSFSTYDQKSPDDDRTPLNTGTAGSMNSGGPSGMADDGAERYGAGRRSGSLGRNGVGAPYNGPRDQYGNPLPPAMPDQYGRNGYPNDRMNPQGFRGRGRGGYPPRGGYGRGGPNAGRGGSGRGRGGMPMRGMAMGAGAGMVAGDMMGRGQRNGPTPPGSRGGPNPYGTAYGAPADYQRRQSPGPRPRYGPGSGPQSRSPGPPSAPGGYGRNPSPGPPSAPGAAYGYGGDASSHRSSWARAESPPPLPGEAVPVPDPGMIGQAIEMDHHTGSPATTPALGSGSFQQPFRDSDSDFQGLVGLQQQKEEHNNLANPMSPSIYSGTDSYAPRSTWDQGAGAPTMPHMQQQPQPTAFSPVGMASSSARRPPPRLHQSPVGAVPSHARMSSGENKYYEDVPARFSDPAVEPNAVPLSLMPGGGGPNSPIYQQDGYLTSGAERQPLEPSHSYDSIQDGPESESSEFTSISQRGVNPQWSGPENGYDGGVGNSSYAIGGIPNRGPGGGGGGGGVAPQQRSLMLSDNPDFAIPGAPRGGRVAGGSAVRGGRGGFGGMI